MKFKPAAGCFLIRKDEKEGQTQSGIIIPEAAQDKVSTGTVVAVGEGEMLQSGMANPPLLKVGDRVWFNKYGGIEVTLGDEELSVIKGGDLVGYAR
jgi:chaperonin GroES